MHARLTINGYGRPRIDSAKFMGFLTYLNQQWCWWQNLTYKKYEPSYLSYDSSIICYTFTIMKIMQNLAKSCFVKNASFHGILPPFRYVQDSGRSNKITSPWQDLMEPWKWPAVGNFGQNDPNITWWDLDGGHPGSAGISEDVIILAERTGTLSDILKILTTSRTESG